MSPTTEQDYQQIIRQQAQIIRRQQRRIAELEKKVQELSAQVARLSKNSSNSSKPPSSDIVKPPKLPGQKGAKIGGQAGHARHERPPFAPDQIDRVADYRLDRCPDCGAAMRPMKRPTRTIQQVEMPDVPLTVTEHRAHAAWCPRYGKAHWPTWSAM